MMSRELLLSNELSFLHQKGIPVENIISDRNLQGEFVKWVLEIKEEPFKALLQGHEVTQYIDNCFETLVYSPQNQIEYRCTIYRFKPREQKAGKITL